MGEGLGTWIVRPAVLLVAVGLAWLAISETVAPLVAANSPELALKIRPGLATALNAKNSQSLGAADISAQLQRSLIAAPLNAATLRDMGSMAANAGHPQRAQTLMTLSKGMTRRDTLVQNWLYYRDLADRDYPAALSDLDPSLRRRAVSIGLVVPPLAPTLNQPEAIEALARQLASAPPWRSDLISELGSRPDAADLLSTLFDKLTDLGSAPSTEEKTKLIGLWAASGDYLKAAQAAGATVGRITDGDFSGSKVSTPFNWDLRSAGQVTAELSLGANGQRGLRVGWPATQSTRITQQLLILPAGAYRFTGLVKVDSMAEGGWIVWRLACVSSPGSPLAEVRQTEVGPWANFSSNLSVPAGCPGVWLTLSTLGGDTGQFSTAWFDSLAITRQGA